MVFSFRNESLYLMVRRISCAPAFGSPSNSIGMLNGTGESGSSSSMYCVDYFMLELLSGSNVTDANRPFTFPSLRTSPITVCFPDKSITSTL